MPGDIIALARRFMNQPVHIRASNLEDEGAVVSRIEQHVIRAHAMDKTMNYSREFCKQKIADRPLSSVALNELPKNFR
jgi:superfamily II DNA/RNA helicase